MRARIVAVCAFAAVTAVPSAAQVTPHRKARAGTVTVANNYFTPTTIRVRRTHVVTWRWVGGSPHNVIGLNTGGRPMFKSRTSALRGYHYSHRFRHRGVFTVICSIHPKTMRMYVRVR